MMNSKALIIISAVLTVGMLFGCADDNASQPLYEPESKAPSVKIDQLRVKFSDDFLIGAAVDSESYQTHAELLTQHFNSITAENEMKFESLQPSRGEFTFDVADKMLAFAEDNNMAVRGHALVWHRQTPDWVFFSDAGKLREREEVLSIMKTHIERVVGHFKGRVDAWDVVNEAVMDDGSMRTDQHEADDQKSLWYGAMGEEYIAAAFHAAHEADPEAKLFYNDYYNHLPARREAIYHLLKSLLDDGVPVHGVGLQAHVSTVLSPDPEHQSHHQSMENLEAAIQRYASLGLDVHITELDMSLYVGGQQYTPDDFYTATTVPAELDRKQAERYAQLFAIFKRNSDLISSVSFWGVADDNTWLSEFDSGRADFPLLFDAEHQPKSAFHAIMDL
ncbi:MAG TPA: endo-1,4-beta-xylanase [Cellvibrionaceae bacterium]